MKRRDFLTGTAALAIVASMPAPASREAKAELVIKDEITGVAKWFAVNDGNTFCPLNSRKTAA